MFFGQRRHGDSDKPQSPRRRRSSRRSGSASRLCKFESLERRALLSAVSGDISAGILLLNQTAAGSLRSTGSGGVYVTGGAIVVDSNSARAATIRGAGNISADEIDATGGLARFGFGRFIGPVVHPTPMLDPLSTMTIPTSGGPIHPAVNVAGTRSLTLSPGIYAGGIHLGGSANVTLLPGVYILQGGGMSVRGNAKLTGTGVTIYNAPRSIRGTIDFHDNCTVSLTAPTSGDYKNVALFQSRSANAPLMMAGGNVTITGKIYAPAATLSFCSGRAMNVIGSAALGITGGIVVNELLAGGGGRLKVDATRNGVETPQSGITVSISDGVDSVAPGSVSTYTIAIANTGTTDAHGVNINVQLPGQISDSHFYTYSPNGATGSPYGYFGDINDVADLPAGSTLYYYLSAYFDPSSVGTVYVLATVTPSGQSSVQAADIDTLVAQRDLATAIYTQPTSAIPGSTLSYDLYVSNLSPVNAAGVNVTATVTGGGLITGYTVYGPYSDIIASGAGDISFTDSNLFVYGGGYSSYHIDLTTDPSATGAITCTLTATLPQVLDVNPSNNTFSVTTPILPVTDLSVSIEDGVTSVVVGQTTTYTIIVQNNGATAVTGAHVVDQFPIGDANNLVPLAGVAYTAHSDNGGSGFTAAGSGNIDDLVDLPVGSSVVYTVTATLNPSVFGSLTDAVSVAPPDDVIDVNASDNYASDQDAIVGPPADLEVTMTDNVASAVAGGTVTYQITVKNNGPNDVVGAQVSDYFPTGNVFILGGLTTLSRATSLAADNSTSGTLALNGASSYTGSTTVQGGTLTIAGSGSTTTTNTGVTVTNGTLSGGTLSTGQGAGLVKAGSGSLTLSGTNSGTSGTITTIGGGTIIIGPPYWYLGPLASITYMAQSDSGATGFTASGVGNINDTVNLPAGSSIVYTAVATLRPDATGSLGNTASVGAPSAVSDPNTSNNYSTDVDFIIAPPPPNADLQISQTDNVTSAHYGDSVTYTLTMSNNGPDNVIGAQLTDYLPAGFFVNSVLTTATGGATVQPASGFILITSASPFTRSLNMPSGSSLVMQINGNMGNNVLGDFVNTATITPPSGGVDANLSNNASIDIDQNLGLL